MFSGMDLLFLEVNNLEESVAFYVEKLGFEPDRINQETEPPIATLRAGALKITLVQQLETMLRRGRGANFFIGVEDIDQFHALLEQRGIIVPAPADEGWGGRFVSLEDPDKYRYFFVTWEH
jgi:catechol 2,3-dioxygenase-like lactoylglutathione lyase family enzyme